MKILHISDIHVSTDEKRKALEEDEVSITEKIADAIQRCGDKGLDLWPDIIVVTGDFTTIATASEFEMAYNILKEFRDNDCFKVKKILLVPGNHDCLWRESGKSVPRENRFIEYRNFRNHCQSEKICIDDLVSDDKLKKGLDSYLISHIYEEEDDFSVLIIGMNSVVLDSEERKGQGFFSQRQHKVCKKLIEYYEGMSGNKELIVLAAFHHHILPVSSVEKDTVDSPDRFSLTLDARRTLDFFLENGVNMALHGHEHQPSIVNWGNKAIDSDKQVYVVAAGSMMKSREHMGDISRNNFMLYDIRKERAEVYLFQSQINNWDVMEPIDEAPYILEFYSPFKNVECNVRKNAFAPIELENVEFDTSIDTSDLYYLFLNVLDCTDAREGIENYINLYNAEKERKVILCGIHHLYGKYDILVKYRSKESDEQFQIKLVNYLAEKKYTERKQPYYFMNVICESSGINESKNIKLLRNPDAYLNSTWNMATLTVYTGRKLMPKDLLEQMNKEILLFDQKYQTKLEDIIRNYAIGQDQSIIFELFISCYQFPMLTRFTNLIEGIIKKYGIDKSTHIIYYFDERHI